MYNKSGSRNKQNKAIEKTTTEKKRDKKREREEAAKGTCNILAMRFISFFGCNCLQSTEGFSRTHTHTILRTHTLTSLDLHTHTYSPTKGQCAAHYSKTRNQLQKWRQQCSMCSSQLATCCTRIVRGIHSSNTINWQPNQLSSRTQYATQTAAKSRKAKWNLAKH